MNILRPLFSLPQVQKKSLITLCLLSYFLQIEEMEFSHDGTHACSNSGVVLSMTSPFETLNIYKTPKNEQGDVNRLPRLGSLNNKTGKSKNIIVNSLVS